MSQLDRLVDLVERLKQVGRRLHCVSCHGEGWVQVADGPNDVTWEPCTCNPLAT